MSIQIITIDNRKKRIARLLQEAKKEKPRNIEKIISLHKQMSKLREEDFLG